MFWHKLLTPKRLVLIISTVSLTSSIHAFFRPVNWILHFASSASNPPPFSTNDDVQDSTRLKAVIVTDVLQEPTNVSSNDDALSSPRIPRGKTQCSSRKESKLLQLMFFEIALIRMGAASLATFCLLNLAIVVDPFYENFREAAVGAKTNNSTNGFFYRPDLNETVRAKKNQNASSEIALRFKDSIPREIMFANISFLLLQTWFWGRFRRLFPKNWWPILKKEDPSVKDSNLSQEFSNKDLRKVRFHVSKMVLKAVVHAACAFALIILLPQCDRDEDQIDLEVMENK